MLRMSSFDMNTRTERSFAPLNCVTDDNLLETMPDIDQPLLQFINVMNFRLVHSLLQQLHFSPNFVVSLVRSRTTGGQRYGEMKAGVSQSTTLTVWRARGVQ